MANRAAVRILFSIFILLILFYDSELFIDYGNNRLTLLEDTHPGSIRNIMNSFSKDVEWHDMHTFV